jgi:hypothetical protein
MSRHKKSRGLPPWLNLLLLLIIGVAGYWSLRQGGGEASLHTTVQLDPALYYDNANSLRGNTYKIDVEIDSSLGNSLSKGRLFSVVLKQPGKQALKGDPPVILPVLVPPALGSLTIQKGQHYLMKVKVIEDGLLKVEEANKP